MSVILKKEEKISEVVSLLNESFSTDDFITKFKALHPKDWERLESSYKAHERRTKSGKSHPMPEPKQYLKNALHVWQKKQSN